MSAARALVLVTVVVAAAAAADARSAGPDPHGLEAAEAFLDAHAWGLPPRLVEQERANLATARAMLAALGAEEPGLAVVRLAARWQAAALGVAWGEAPRVADHAAPSEAAGALLALHGVEPTAEQARGMRDLDGLHEPVRSSLAALFDAFLSHDLAARAAFGAAEMPAADPAGTPGEALRRTGIDLSHLFPARERLLEAAQRLADDLRAFPPLRQEHGPTHPPLQVPPVFSLELEGAGAPGGGRASNYSQDFALLVDAGGDDLYMNNAGGGSALAARPAALLLDLGGDDRYLDLRGGGTNGGGRFGSGMLLDLDGHDRYTARSSGANGGAFVGLGLLLDRAGNDVYIAEHDGTNGGGRLGLGLLVDLAGDDGYCPGHRGTNGGGEAGVGMLVEAGGSDLYTSGHEGTTGGGRLGGVGFLLEAGGDDTYLAGERGVTGGAVDLGVGFLLDAGGSDAYAAGAFGANGGASGAAALGLLVNVGGVDSYDDAEPAAASGRGTDRTVAPKGLVGAQLDV